MIGRTLGVGVALLLGCTGRDPGGSTGTTGETDMGVLDTGTVALPTTEGGATETGSSSGSSAGTTEGTSGSSAGTTFCPCECSEAVVELRMPTIELVFVLDKANTMNGTWDHDAMPGTPAVPRWESLHRAVEQTVTGFEASLRMGLSLFPSVEAVDDGTPQGACPVENPNEVLVGPQQAAAIMGAMPAAMAVVAGGTPAAHAIAVTVEELVAGDQGNPQHIVYVADGAANCDGADAEAFETYDEALHDYVASAWENYLLTTHVIGLAIADETSPMVVDGLPDLVNNYEKLNELAIKGGAARPGDDKFFNAKNETELVAAFDAVIRGVLPCTMVLDPPPLQPDFVEVEVAGIDYGKSQVTDCATEDGWLYVEPGVSVALCGQACRDFQTAGVFEAIYRCGDESCCE